MKSKIGFNPWLITGLVAASGYLALNRAISWLRADFKGKVVLITGGSRGLGMILARDFALEGAKVAVCARNEDELIKARDWLMGEGVKEIFVLPCDVTRQGEVEHMVTQVNRVLGPIDILINNAGTISVAPLESLTVDDFKRAQDVMFWGVLYPTLAVLPKMRQRKQGHIVNITSIGGVVSIPHLIAYSSAKFAAVGFSQGLHTELKRYGIKVTTILPGLMRTGSFVNAEFKGNKDKEYSWFSLAASLPLLSMSAERASQLVIQAVKQGAAFRILGVPAKMAATIYSLFPEFSASALSLVNRLMPEPGEQELPGSQATQGKDLESDREPRPLRLLKGLGRAAIENYQT